MTKTKAKAKTVKAWGIITKRGRLIRWAIDWKSEAMGRCIFEKGERVVRVAIKEITQ